MSTNYADEVGNLLGEAFRNLRHANKAEGKGSIAEASAQRIHAALQVNAAQAAATLALAQEVRTVALLLAGRGHDPLDPALPNEAFTAAVIHLGLVDTEEPDADADNAGLYPDGGDPADKDVEP